MSGGQQAARVSALSWFQEFEGGGDQGLGKGLHRFKRKAARCMSDMVKAMKASPVLFPVFAKYGTSRGVNNHSSKGIFPAKNWTATGEFAPVDRVGMEARQSHKIGQTRCAGCP